MEQDVRLAILNATLRNHHGNLAELVGFCQEAHDRDPLFFGPLASWYFANGDLRDVKCVMVAVMCVSNFSQEYRRAGCEMLMELPPHLVHRVVRLVKGDRKSRAEAPSASEATTAGADRAPADAGSRTPRTKRARGGAGRAIAGSKTPHTNRAIIDRREELWTRVLGFVPGKKLPKKQRPQKVAAPSLAPLVNNAPHSFRAAVERYLRERESDPRKFETAVLFGRHDLKALYSMLHVKPSALAQQVLFERRASGDSRLGRISAIAQLDDPVEQARRIAREKVPYRAAIGMVRRLTPSVLAALIDGMSSQELLNSMGALKAQGALKHDDLRALVEEKLRRAAGDERVAALKTRTVLDHVTLDRELADAVRDVGDARIAARAGITARTALFVDKSGSMHSCIELGKRVAAMIAPLCERDLFVYAFDSVPLPIFAKGKNLSDFEHAFNGVEANGSTSIGAPLEAMRRTRQAVDQIIVVTDQEENASPCFQDAFRKYAAAMNVWPRVIVVAVGGGQRMEHECMVTGIECQTWEFQDDYYSLPGLLPLLRYPTRLDLLLEILAHPLGVA